jgi:hypothetical protein
VDEKVSRPKQTGPERMDIHVLLACFAVANPLISDMALDRRISERPSCASRPIVSSKMPTGRFANIQ